MKVHVIELGRTLPPDLYHEGRTTIRVVTGQLDPGCLPTELSCLDLVLIFHIYLIAS